MSTGDSKAIFFPFEKFNANLILPIKQAEEI
jgi:hypothetical protein